MVTFRGLAWPNKTSVNRLDRSDLSQTTPSSPAEIETPSVQDLVVQLEAKQEQARRRSSVGDRPSTPNFRVHPFRPVIPYSRTPSPNPASKLAPVPKELVEVQEKVDRGLKARPATPDLDRKVVPLVFTTAEGETIYQPYSLPPTPPVGGEDTGLDFNPHVPSPTVSKAIDSSAVDFENLPPLPDSPFTFSQSPRTLPKISQNGTEELSPLASPFTSIRPIVPLSPLNLAVDSAADSSPRTKPTRSSTDSRSSTPLSFYKLDPASTVTFNTSVRDLIQEAPDSPIGGQPAAPMDDRAVGTMAVQGKSLASPPPMMKKPLRSRSNYSDSVPDPSRRNQHSNEPFAALENTAIAPRVGTPQSEASMAMVTAPDTPIFGRRNEYSDMSDIAFDGSPGSGTEVKDFAVVDKVTESNSVPEVDVCPDCDLPSAQPGDPVASTGLSLPSCEAPTSSVPSSGISPSGAPNLPASKSPASGISPGGLPTSTIPVSGISAPEAPSVSLPRASQVGIDGLYVPGSNLPGGLAVPADITGKLDPPGTPVPSKKRMALGKGKKKGQKVVRRGRHLILRKPVLALVIGRQLAGPTSAALKLVSKGTAVDPTAFKDAAVPDAVPQPVPLPA
ncbi:hypothetical protein IFR05_003188 [Cadophora sp. M221]|nr:hypothetical protein IFR05_003188 [Cadophora sp. M221]